MLATRSHRTQLADLGIDVRRSADEGRYVALDAAQLLASIMVDGSPDRTSFRDAIVPVIERAAGRATPVRVYGELVALLLAAGDVTDRPAEARCRSVVLRADRRRSYGWRAGPALRR